MKQPKLQERYEIISFPYDPSSLESLNEMANYLTNQAGRNNKVKNGGIVIFFNDEHQKHWTRLISLIVGL